MGVCTCTSKSSYESTFREFWLSMKVRNTPSKDLCEMIKMNVNKGTISENNWVKIIQKLLCLKVTDEEFPCYSNLWKNAYETMDLKYLVLGMYFLCNKDNLNAKKYFEDTAKVIFGLKSKFKEETKITFFDKNELSSILNCYVQLISLFSIKFVQEGFSSFSSEIIEQLQNYYSEGVIREYVESILSEYEGDMVDLDAFFRKQYLELINDSEVRENLYSRNNLTKRK